VTTSPVNGARNDQATQHNESLLSSSLVLRSPLPGLHGKDVFWAESVSASTDQLLTAGSSSPHCLKAPPTL
jgi:hypothetical protein